MREPYASVQCNRRALARSPCRAREVAEPIHRNRDGFLEGRDKKAGGQVGQMMLDAVNSAAEGIIGESPHQLALNRKPLALVVDAIPDEFQIRSLSNRIPEAAQDIRLRIAVDRDMVDLGQRSTGLPEAIVDCL